MNYGMPLEPFGIGNQSIDSMIRIRMLEQEIYQMKTALNSIEQRLNALESKETKNDKPQFLNSSVENTNGGLYMI